MKRAIPASSSTTSTRWALAGSGFRSRSFPITSSADILLPSLLLYALNEDCPPPDAGERAVLFIQSRPSWRMSPGPGLLLERAGGARRGRGTRGAGLLIGARAPSLGAET